MTVHRSTRTRLHCENLETRQMLDAKMTTLPMVSPVTAQVGVLHTQPMQIDHGVAAQNQIPASDSHAVTIYSVVTIRNETNNVVYYSLQWPGSDWKGFSVAAHSYRIHWCTGQNLTPTIEYDWSFAPGYQGQRYSLPSRDFAGGGPAGLTPSHETDGMQYFFTLNSDQTGLNLYADNTTPDSQFQIDIRFTDGNLSTAQTQVFEEAAARWSSVIVGDVPDVMTSQGLIDDLLIDVSAPYIDGPGNILGQAGWDKLREDGSDLPYHGVMELDATDVADMETSGRLFDVILHEMGHVLGFGTLWDEEGLIRGAGGPDPQYTGPAAVAEYRTLFGGTANSVPVESEGGPGTRDSHWRETVFKNELMTGWVNQHPNPLSRITVAAMADLGYTVNLEAADSFDVSIRNVQTPALMAGSASTDSAPAVPILRETLLADAQMPLSLRLDSRSALPDEHILGVIVPEYELSHPADRSASRRLRPSALGAQV